jgi:hypothetical protein
MKKIKIASIFSIVFLLLVNTSSAQQGAANNSSDFLVYNVKQSAKTVDVNDGWNESGWKEITWVKFRHLSLKQMSK